jgi:dihydropyrimidinase
VKISGRTISDVTGGHNGAETRVGITYSEGVSKRGMSLQRFVDVTSANAAKIMGLYPQKGVIAPGSDADLVLIDPEIKKRLAGSDFHISDYSIWDGFDIEGWPVMTILRGSVVVEDGELNARLGGGQFLRRKVDPAVANRPVV